jgi:hypothetical protein
MPVTLRHVPALFGATTTTFGGMVSIFYPRSTMLSFGLPAHIADIDATWPVWVIGQAHTTVIGILIFIFYFRRQLDVIDIILGVSSAYAALIDSYVIYNQGEVTQAAVRLVLTGSFAVWGLTGMTSSR